MTLYRTAGAATLSIGLIALPAPRHFATVAAHFDRTEWAGVVGWPTCWPDGVVIHHTATPDTIAGHPVDVALLDYLHGHRGFFTWFAGRVYHVGYHYLILPEGNIQAGRPERCEGAHAGRLDVNRTYLGIALVGNFDSSNVGVNARRGPTAKQLASLETLARELMDRYHFSASRIVGHSDVNPDTRCPGNLFSIQAWRQHLYDAAQGRPSGAP